MHFRIRRIWLITTVVVAFHGTVSVAAPLLGVSPDTIDRAATGTVQIQVSGLQGGSPQAVLRLIVDADSDGIVDPEDYPIWTDVIDDDVVTWSPAMFSDENAAPGTVTVNVRSFGPFSFPYTTGDFIWQAEDSFDSSTASVPFSVTEAAQVQSVSGTVTDGASLMPGALVILEPFCDSGEEASRFYSTVADASGAYSIQIPADLDCNHRLLLAGKPGYLTSFVGQPHLVFGGSSVFVAQDLQLTPGTHLATGQITYDGGPRDGLGIPGLTVFVDGNEGNAALGFTDENGSFAFTLSDGDWRMETSEDDLATRGVVGLEDGVAFTVAGGPAVLPPISIAAANAFFQGTLFDDNATPVGGQWVRASRAWPCGSECYEIEALTHADGTFTLGIVAPAGPSTYDYWMSVADPLPGLVGQQRGCELISAGQTLTGKDLSHLTPTSFIRGKMSDKNRQGLDNMCVSAWGGAGGECTGYSSAAVTECDGTYAVPVVDGQWNLQIEVEDTASLYRDLDATTVDREVVVTGGNDADGIDFIIGRTRTNPTVTFVEPTKAHAGDSILIGGYAFSHGSTPVVRFGGTPATVLSFRSELGRIVVEVPGSLPPGGIDLLVDNVDLGKTSEAACFEVLVGSSSTTCSISGVVTESGSGSPVSGAVVLIEDSVDEFFAGSAVTDGTGAYSVDLEAGSYFMEIIPPAGQPWAWGVYDVNCGAAVNHAFTAGSQLTGRVVDDRGDGLSGAHVEAEATGGNDGWAAGVTDEDGYFSMYVPDGNYQVFIDPPPGSRFTTVAPLTPAVVGSTDVGQITMSRGFYFCSAVKDPDGAPVNAELEAFRRSDSAWAGFADTNTCSGQADFALPEGEYRLEIIPVDLDVDGPTDVAWVDVQGDRFAGFDFVVADRSSVRGGSEPRINPTELEPVAQTGQPILIAASNIGGATVDALFSNTTGGFVPGDDTLRDVARGMLVTRVPAGAATGEIKLRVDGVDGPGVPFTVNPGLFSPGSTTVSGVVNGPVSPVNGAFVGLFWIDPTGDCDEDDGQLMDYAVTDAAGNYGPLNHPGGDIFVAALPPATAALAANFDERFDVFANTTIDFSLPGGFAVQLRAVDDDVVPAPMAGVEVFAEGDTAEDWRVTDAGGNATLYLAAGDYQFELIPTAGSRVVEGEFQATVSGPVDLGDRTLQRGVLVGSAVVRQSDGSAVADGYAEAQRGEAPWDFFFESTVGADGSFRGPVVAGSIYQWQVNVPADDVADYQDQNRTAGTRDTIFYPAIELGPAGFVEGVVIDAATTEPLEGINVNSNVDDGGSPGDNSGFTQTCGDGSYRLKLAVGGHFLQFYDWEQNIYVTEWSPDSYCFDGAVPVTITEGATATADADLDAKGTISGVVTVNLVPEPGASVCSTADSLGTCQFCGPGTDASGNYTIDVPPAPDYRVEAFVPGEGTECYNDFDSCSSFDPVTVTPGGVTPDIDFDFGCSDADVDGDGFSECAGDCDDNDPNRFPGNSEICDGVDNNCDEVVPANEADNDDDGAVACADCDDADPLRFPGNFEACDGIDNDCDTVVPATEIDDDLDGFSECAGDCDDTSGATFPGAPEICDGLDNDCDTVVPANEADDDVDGVLICAGDCDDANAATFPGAPEICDGLDNDCDTVVPANEADDDVDGVLICAGDCDDANAATFPGAPEICDGLDNDCDTVVPADEIDDDLDGFSECAGDCDDTSGATFPGAPELCDGLDNDCDTVVPATEIDDDLDGFSECAGDCDDTSGTTFPGAPELCDGLDNDCDTVIPASETDDDTDSYVECTIDVGGWDGTPVTGGDDCNDTDGTVYPDALELCDGLDNNCDLALPVNETDDDTDGYVECTVDVGGWDGAPVTGGDDCNDTDGTIYPDALELCDGLDNDCDTALPVNETDDDTDGYVECTVDVGGWDGTPVTGGEDCNDAEGTVFPGAPELCDGLDNDCDTVVPANEADDDVDGVLICAGDCDDANAATFPGAPEICDGLDNDCDTVVPATEIDDDLDGFSECAGDCDDTSGATFPGAPELCDGIDNDCDTVVPATEIDDDLDGFSECAGDCDDTSGATFPGAPELCDGLDNDCDTVVPANEADDDVDGVLICAGDCDDANAATFPGAPEICDGLDNDCDTVVPATEIDDDLDGFSECAGDCDDTSGATFPGAPELCDGIDNDCDTVVPATEIDDDLDGFSECAGDCDDTSGATFPGAPELCDGLDNDCDTVVPANEADDDVDGVLICAGDCDDANAATFPGAPEICDGLDNDCDTVVPATEIDDDLDGFSECAGDCDDTSGATFPGAPELCDGIDNDCDTVVPATEIDDDLDGFSECAGDCDDTSGATFPGAPELCDGLDNDCDTVVPANEADDDVDGVLICAGDCDDANAATFPGAPEICDGLDNDCDTVVPATEIDDDLDGFSECAGDCDDTSGATFPGAPELCDGIDNDCDTVVPATEIDDDLDGFSECAGDCDDTSGATFPGAPELCDGLDNDCDTVVPANEADDDVDGVLICAGDCDDANAATFPGAPEICDGLDNDCDTVVPATEIDDDLDGFSECAGDCDDTSGATFPGAPELCDGIDNDCDTVVPATEIDDDLDGFSECAGDCDDTSGATFPGAPELCDGLDNDCDTVVPANEADDDVDGVLICAGDCDDANAATFPGAPEICDGIDNDCDTVVPATEIDDDGDGVLICAGDCDDANAATFPGAPELCDGIDNDCDTVVPATEIDDDLDGFSECAGDCDDTSGATFPGALELCDGLDNDCDTVVPANEADDDVDGVLICAGDCDDANAATFPGAPEICDGIDNDCDTVVPATEIDDDGDGMAECAGDCDDVNPLRFAGNPEVCDGQDNNCDGTPDEGFDADTDGVTDCTDNCENTANPDQKDFDLDGMGDVCETGTSLADIDISSRVDGFDLASLARAFASSCGEVAYSAEADLDRDCMVDGSDLAILASEFGLSYVRP